jgi:hypothetical protein
VWNYFKRPPPPPPPPKEFRVEHYLFLRTWRWLSIIKCVLSQNQRLPSAFSINCITSKGNVRKYISATGRSTLPWSCWGIIIITFERVKIDCAIWICGPALQHKAMLF